MKKNEVNNLIYYADMLKKYDSNINIHKCGSKDIVNFNGKEHKISSEEEYILLIKKIICFNKPTSINDLFNACTNLVNFMVKNSNYKIILEKIFPNYNDFKGLFMMAIHIDNSPNIFKSVTDKQLEKVNYDNINTLLSNFIVNNNNSELENMSFLEADKISLLEKINSIQSKISILTQEKDKKNKDMEEKNATMQFYVEFKKLMSNIREIEKAIKKYDGTKLEYDINNIQLLQKLDEIKLNINSYEKNFITKFINKKSILELNRKLEEIKNSIKDNNNVINNSKKNTKDLNLKKKQLVIDFCVEYNKSAVNDDEKLASIEDIKLQFDKIRTYESFKNERELVNLIEQQNMLNSELSDIEKKTKYKDKFYLLYQIKKVCEIMNIPIEEVIDENLIKLTSNNKSKVTK